MPRTTQTVPLAVPQRNTRRWVATPSREACPPRPFAFTTGHAGYKGYRRGTHNDPDQGAETKSPAIRCFHSMRGRRRQSSHCGARGKTSREADSCLTQTPEDSWNQQYGCGLFRIVARAYLMRTVTVCPPSTVLEQTCRRNPDARPRNRSPKNSMDWSRHAT